MRDKRMFILYLSWMFDSHVFSLQFISTVYAIEFKPFSRLKKNKTKQNNTEFHRDFFPV